MMFIDPLRQLAHNMTIAVQIPPPDLVLSSDVADIFPLDLDNHFLCINREYSCTGRRIVALVMFIEEIIARREINPHGMDHIWVP